MRCLSHLRALTVMAAVVLLSLATVSVTSADSATGTQNPDLTVSVSLRSNGLDPNVANVGNTITASQSVTNNTARTLVVIVSNTIRYGQGQSYTASRKVILRPGKALALTATFTVYAFIPNGIYRQTVSATDAQGTSSATASITIAP